jgi:hypothetical protein
VDRTEDVIIPAGLEITVSLSSELNSARIKPGDEFAGSLAGPLVRDGVTVLDRGTDVRGRIEEVDNAGRVNGVANMRLILTSLVHNGRTIPITTQSIVVEAEPATARDAAAVAAAAGTVIGAITGGTRTADASGRATVPAAAVGPVDLAEGSKLTFVLAGRVAVRP